MSHPPQALITPVENDNVDNFNQDPEIINPQEIIARKFLLKHKFRAGAIVWVKNRKDEDEDYYVVFRSLTRPHRGIQLPGGRVEKLENIAEAVIREVAEEVGIQTKILCPLGLMYLNNDPKNLSRLEIYYIVRPIKPLNVYSKWFHIDWDNSRQRLECSCVSVSEDTAFLADGQGKVVEMFKTWLKEHRPKNFNLSQSPKHNIPSPSSNSSEDTVINEVE